MLRALYPFVVATFFAHFIILSYARADGSADLYRPQEVQDKVEKDKSTEDKPVEDYKALKAPRLEEAPRTKIDRAPDGIQEQIYGVDITKKSIIQYEPFNFFIKPWRKYNSKLKNAIGLEFSLAYTALYQVANRATQGEGRNQAASVIWDFNGLWSVLPKKWGNPGYIGFRSRSKHTLFTDIPPNSLAGEIGSLWSTAAFFTVNNFAVSQLWWEQHLFADKLIFRAGKLDQSNYIDSFNFSSSTLFFTNAAFSHNPTIPFPGNGLGAAALFQPNDLFYIMGSFGDANGDSSTFEFDTFFDDQQFFTAVEVGFVPLINIVGKGNYHIALWHSDGNKKNNTPSGSGLAITFQQSIRNNYNTFLRYSFSNGKVTNVKQILSGGVGVYDPFNKGLKDNLLGLAVSWGEPEDQNLRAQYVIESFLRLQFFKSMQVTPDIQLIMSPSNAPDENFVAVFGLRFRVAF
jgi:porin